MAARPALRTDALHALASENGWLRDDGEISSYAVAAALGVDRTTISRLVRGHHRPGPAVIASLLQAAPKKSFSDLFTTEEVAA